MNIVSTSKTIADYCQEMSRNEIVVNREYQRSDKVWPAVARSYLIETIVLGYPLPKLSLYQITDIKSKKTFKEIVDGQQRSAAIIDFFDNKLRLSRSLETESVAGRTYSEIDEHDKHRFLDYPLSLDLFVAATREEVREVFRRMNSYTVPLNPEEHRHASFQGRFKWFIHRITKRFDQGFVDTGVFGEKQLIRMADAKLISEVCDAMLNGIRTTNKIALDRLYKSWNKDFPQEREFEARITEGLDQLREWTPIHRGALMKPYIVYAILLAIMHIRRSVPALEHLFTSPNLPEVSTDIAIPNLLALSDSLENPEVAGMFGEFVSASSSRTNVREQREKRFLWMCNALTQPF